MACPQAALGGRKLSNHVDRAAAPLLHCANDTVIVYEIVGDHGVVTIITKA